MSMFEFPNITKFFGWTATMHSIEKTIHYRVCHSYLRVSSLGSLNTSCALRSHPRGNDEDKILYCRPCLLVY